MNEIKRLQQLAGIITEIKVNNPLNYEKIFDECWGQALDEVGEFSGGNDFEDEEVENESEVSEYARELFKQRTGKEYDDLNEDVSDFNIGQSSETGGRRTTVTDIDPETQSVTWSVKKEVDDSTIHKDLTDLISKFEKVQLKDFHSRPKLIQLVKDLKSIRNKFSRTVVKEDLRILKENLVGILNEIKVNQPQLKKFNDYMHILDFFGGELPQNFKQAQSEALRAGYDLTLQEYTVADQNSTFSEIKVNNPNLVNINDLEIGKKYKFIFDEGTGLREKTGEVIEIDKNPQEGELRIEIYSPGDKYEYEELYSDDIIKIINNG